MPAENPSGKSGSERAIFLVRPGTEDFVQSAARDATSRQSPIYLGNAEGQDAMRCRRRPLDLPNALT